MQWKATKTEEDAKKVFFFIPDISGFTDFIKNTNLREGTQLIHDLLEVIIDSNITNLSLAEIQGDSVWFYRLDNPVSLVELEQQTIKTFTDFQCALSKIEGKHPLLSRARYLTLKIFTHYGKVITTSVKGIIKLVGPDTVIAQRLMKNNIKGKEYLLVTDQYLKNQIPDPKTFNWDKFNSGFIDYEFLGRIGYSYISLTPLRQWVCYPV